MQQSYHPHSQHPAAQPHIQSPQPHTGSGPQLPAAGMQNPQQPLYQHQADPYYYQYGEAEYGYLSAGTAVPAVSANGVGGWFEFSNAGYLKGFLVAAGATLILTNPVIQKALVRGTVKLWSLVQGGVEEVKEQFQDIKAEMSQEK